MQRNKPYNYMIEVKKKCKDHSLQNPLQWYQCNSPNTNHPVKKINKILIK